MLLLCTIYNNQLLGTEVDSLCRIQYMTML